MKIALPFIFALCTSIGMLQAQEEVKDYNPVKIELAASFYGYNSIDPTRLTSPSEIITGGASFLAQFHYFVRPHIAFTSGVEWGGIQLKTDQLKELRVTTPESLNSVVKTRIFQGLTLNIPVKKDSRWIFDGTLGFGWVSYRYPEMSTPNFDAVKFAQVSGINVFGNFGIAYRLSDLLGLHFNIGQQMDVVDYSVIYDGINQDDDTTELIGSTISLGLTFDL